VRSSGRWPAVLALTPPDLDVMGSSMNDGLTDDAEVGGADTWLNPERAPKTERARAVVGEVLHQVQNYEAFKELRQRARKSTDQQLFETTITAVIADLIHFHLAGRSGGLVVTRSKTILGKRSRYQPPIYNATFPAILDRLSSPEMAFAEQSKGHVFDFESGGRKRTTIRPGSRLISAIERAGLTFDDLCTTAGDEPIVLKTAPRDWWDQSAYVDYEDTDATRLYRRETVAINAWLEAADLSFDESAAPDLKVDVSERRLRRIFTRESFESGGRLFGGFWQQLSKEVRREGVRIDGDEVRLLDYSQMNPRIAYGLAKTTPSMQDVYRVPGFEDESCRVGIKKFFNAMLFATKPIIRMPKGTREKFSKGVSASQVAQAILKAHPVLKFYQGGGHYIQFMESQIMVGLLLDLKDRNITALPIHDAVCVPLSRAEEARAAMVAIFRSTTGIDVQVNDEGETEHDSSDHTNRV
jgi:hypothetical protein